MRDAAVGGVVHGHKLLEKIGEGHYGEVWRAEYAGQAVALKLFTGGRPSVHLKQEAFAQYALGRLEGHDARWFPRVEHLGLDEDPPYIRMEFVDGRPLEDVLASQALPLDERLSIAERVLQALAAVHAREFVHGDLSPLNVLVTADRDVRLIDVGYGRVLGEGDMDIAVSTTSEDRPMGVASPLYSAPERFRDDPASGCGKPSDVFSFGKLLYRLVTGEQPFVIKPLSRRFPALGIPWDDFLFRCLEERPEARFPDAAAALAEFRRINRRELVPGEYRAECPECSSAQSIAGGWAGERFDCRGCRRTLEVLFYDDRSRYATTALAASGSASPPPILFLDADIEARTRKFCPRCGGEVKVEAKKCRHCRAWVDDAAREIVGRRRPAVPPARSFVAAAVATLLAYFFYWVPGVILNWYFLREARKERSQSGRPPAGLVGLEVLIWVFVWIPLIAAGAALALGLFLGILAGILA